LAFQRLTRVTTCDERGGIGYGCTTPEEPSLTYGRLLGTPSLGLSFLLAADSLA